MGTPTTPPPGPTTSGPYGQDASQYVLTFSEEFNSGFDTSKWNNHVWYESPNPTINYAVKNGVLKIWPQRDASGRFFNRTIDTDGKYYQTYGFFEMEAKLPIGRGVWPAFWLFNHPGDRRPEIDIMEAYPGGGPNSGWGDANLHPVAFAATVWPNGGDNPSAGHKTLQTVDLSAGFHRYAVKWEPGRQTFYFDGQPFWTVNVSMADPMYIMLDLWFGSASGTPDSTTPTGEGNSFEINYVRAWRFK
ncbi:glycoside hydrolase family 16 protein [Archangium gephyra]|uniref:glycoside hydrolase family 16 protein n=1 Tax=Archangium gephyra TaxID=48 RepID=UPI003B7F454C